MSQGITPLKYSQPAKIESDLCERDFMPYEVGSTTPSQKKCNPSLSMPL